MPRVDGKRSQHGEDLRLEVFVDLPPLGRGEIAHAKQTDVVPRGLVEKRREAAALHRAQARDLGVDRVELLLRGETVRRRQDDAGRDLTPQSRDANHVELVEVRAEDREEFDALEQWHPRVECLLQHTRVERQPTQFAIEVQRGGTNVDHGFSEGRKRRARACRPPVYLRRSSHRRPEGFVMLIVTLGSRFRMLKTYWQHSDRAV